MTTSSSYASSPRWNHSSRGAPLLRAVPSHARDLRALEDCDASSAVALEWLEQVLATVSHERHGAVLRTLHGLADELRAMRDAAARVHAHASGEPLACLFTTSAPLHRALVDLYAWSESLCGALEEIAIGLRRGQAVRSVFLVRTINESYARLDARTAAIREHIAHIARAGGADATRALDEDLEELVWAASWLHLSLTKRFGE